jgi:hypothetical protein
MLGAALNWAFILKLKWRKSPAGRAASAAVFRL